MKTLKLFSTFIFIFFLSFASAQNIKATLLKHPGSVPSDPNSNLGVNWSIGGNGENLEIREPELGNKLWARFVDDQRLELLGTPNLLLNGNIDAGGDINADGSINATGNLTAGVNRLISIGDDEHNLSFTAATCCPGAYVDYRGGPLVFRMSGNASDSPLTLQQNGTVVVNVKAQYGGNIIPTGGHEFAVNGGIYCEEVEVVSDVPNSDYVFEEDYPLLPLEEVDAFIKENKHLPEVPSAEEFKKGYKLGTMDDLLLRKVEELTLYMIDMNEKMKELDNENKALKEQLEALKAKN